MKKMVMLLMTIALAVGSSLSAFAAVQTSAEKTEYTFTYGDNQYRLGMEADEAMETLGEAQSSRDVNNCANGYVNKAYLYGDKDFEVYVEQSGRKEIVTNITLLTSKVSTEEGLKPGDDAGRVTEIYKGAKKGLGSYTAALGETKLYIKIKDNKVSYISYMTEN